MATTKTKLILLATAFGLAACGGGAPGDETPTDPVDPPPVTPDPPDFPNNPPSAALTSLQGEVLTVRIAQSVSTSGGIPVLEFADGTVNLSAFSSTTPINGSVVFNGETITITNGEGELDNGQMVGVTVDMIGTHSAVGSTFTTPPIDTLSGEAYYAFGVETPVGVLNPLTGSVVYSGDFAGSGQVSGTPDVEIDGTVNLSVTFAGGSDSLTGTIDGEYTVGTTPVAVDLTIGSTTFTGNSFTADINCTGCAAEGTFYGPNGEEVSGVMTLNTGNFDGTAGFVLAR